jgi:hypothetical protein
MDGDLLDFEPRDRSNAHGGKTGIRTRQELALIVLELMRGSRGLLNERWAWSDAKASNVLYLRDGDDVRLYFGDPGSVVPLDDYKRRGGACTFRCPFPGSRHDATSAAVWGVVVVVLILVIRNLKGDRSSSAERILSHREEKAGVEAYTSLFDSFQVEQARAGGWAQGGVDEALFDLLTSAHTFLCAIFFSEDGARDDICKKVLTFEVLDKAVEAAGWK